MTISGKILIFVYLLQLLITMFTYGNDTTSNEGSVVGVDALGEVMFNETGYIPRIQLRNSRSLKFIEYNDEIKKFITISAKTIEAENKTFSTSNFDVEPCSQ